MRKIFLLFVSIVTATTIVAAIAAAQEGAVKARLEIVVVGGEPLSQLFGTQIENISLFAMNNGVFEPVPFQIDQRYKKGDELRYAYTGGKNAKADPDPKLDADDELVFWSGDAGDAVSMDTWPADSRGVGISVKDPLGGAVGYVYLLAFNDKAPRTDRRYIRYDPAKDRVETLYYNVGFPSKDKIGFVDMAINPEAGGDGEDFVDEAKYRVDVRLAGTILPYQLNKEDVSSKPEAWIDGPVRAMREVKNYVALWMWLGSTSHAASVFSPMGFYIEIPVAGFSPIKGLTNLSSRWALELNQSAKGMTFRSDKNAEPAAIDGALDEAERKLNYSPPEWLMISGKPGTIIRRPGKLSDKTLFIDLFYMDDAELKDPPEVEPGQIGASGYYIPFAGRRGMKMKENIVEFYDVLPNYAAGDEKQFLARTRNPLEIKVKEVVVSSEAAGPEEFPASQKKRKDEPTPSFKLIGADASEIESQIMPVIVMSSDNGLGGGLMYISSNPFDSHIRLTTQVWYTIKSYGVAELMLGEDVPRKGSDWAWIAAGRYRIRPGMDFYGLGSDTERDEQTNFYDELSSIRLWGKRRVFDHVWLGAYVEGRREFTGDGEGDWCPNTFAPKWYPDLYERGAFWTNRIGGFLLHDTRDSYYIPTKGGYRQIEYYSVPTWMGSDFSFEYWNLDLRQFIPIRQPRKDVLALRLQAMHAEGGPIPFNEMAIVGSEYTLRGYFNGRWRDRDMISVNTELRHNLWKIFDVNFFYDAGRVYNDMFQEGEHLGTDLRDAYGTGFRIAIPPNIVMRADIGWSKTDQVFYFNWGQTF